ncbi:Outer membrane vitamin B12 receptor BtuB [Rhodovastum atsumiense]|uniref:TonB-dependent receptor n=1 Tax=Rhodovastum atsumiense TaxID=504468 RepID=A0A5M6IMN5_9PROT|nr:TonB-dependent receptor [Rhodovastum atsumiense]KAA5609534.1 TonB-dependent receptor [Rhodovastum atsumiense]CAH2604937.1 Outer membrane vitamin B12 receptor BtuB [Rhodovastum atsumiense]
MRRMLLASVLALPALAARAGDAPPRDQTDLVLPEQVVTATRIPTLAELIPAGVTVIDRQTITTRGYTMLSDALHAVPGLALVQSGGNGGNASAFIRGTNSNHVLVLRDGVPLNDPSDPNGAYNFGVETLADVERIEVVRGPMSGLYGSGAIGGVINLISKQGSGAPTATAEFAAGLPRAILGSAGLSGASGMVDYSLAVQSRSQLGFDTTPQRETVHTGERDGYRAQVASLNLGVTPVEGTRISTLLRWRRAVFGLDELGSPAFDAPAYTGRDEAFTGRIGIDSKLFDGLWDTGLSLAYVTTNRKYTEPLEAADPNQLQSNGRYRGYRTALTWTNTVHLADLGPARETALTFGAAHIFDRARSSLTESYAGFPSNQAVGAHATSDSGNAGLQTTLFDRLTATANLRQESASFGGDAFTWRLGGVLALPELWSRAKASYGTGFRAPSLFDLFGVGSYGYVGNPNLRPERSEGWETGWAIDLPALGRRDAATLEVTYFDNRIRDLIQVVYASDFSSSTPQNIARAHITGVETSLTLRPLSWAEAVLSWTCTDARDQSGALLKRRPRNTASANLRATPLPGLTIAPELVYASGASDYLVNDEGFSSGVGMTKGGLIFNLAVSYAVTPQITLFADGRNLGDSRYEPASGFQTPGPSFLAGTRVKF